MLTRTGLRLPGWILAIVAAVSVGTLSPVPGAAAGGAESSTGTNLTDSPSSITASQGSRAAAAGESDYRALLPQLPADGAPDTDMNLNAVACVGAGFCVTGGAYEKADGTMGSSIVTIDNGQLSTIEVPALPNMPAPTIVRISCPTTTFCAAIARQAGSVEGGGQALLVLEDGAWTIGVAPKPPSQYVDPPTLVSISCAAPGRCVAVGAADNQPMVLEITDGVMEAKRVQLPGNAVKLDAAGVYGVSCPTFESCVVIGGYRSIEQPQGELRGMIVRSHQGFWSGEQAPRPPDAKSKSLATSSVDCYAPGACVAIGYYDTKVGPALGIATLKGSVWTAQAAPVTVGTGRFPDRARLTQVACSDSGNCVFGATYPGTNSPWRSKIISRKAGTWTASGVPRPVDAVQEYQDPLVISNVACSEVVCTVGGAYKDTSGRMQVFFADSDQGAWVAQKALVPVSVSGKSVRIDTLTCRTGHVCTAVVSVFDYRDPYYYPTVSPSVLVTSEQVAPARIKGYKPAIVGTVTTGRTLTADVGVWSPQDLQLTYRWMVDGVDSQVGPDNPFVIPESAAGKRITVEVTGSYDGLQSVSTTSEASRPAARGITVVPVTISGTPKDGETLTAVVGEWQPATVELEYYWEYSNGWGPDDRRAQAVQVTEQFAPYSVRVTVTGRREGYEDAVSVSPWVKYIPKPLTPFTISFDGTMRFNEIVIPILNFATSSAAVDPTKYTFQWLQDGAPINGATDGLLQIGSAQIGKKLTIRVTASKDGYQTITRTSAPGATVVPGRLQAVTPRITGSARVGATLTANSGTWGPAPVRYAYQWRSNGKAIAGATARTFKLGASQLGSTITVSVTGRKTDHATTVRTSSVTAAVVPGEFVTVRPGIRGSATAGVRVRALAGSWSPVATSVTYQWLKDGKRIGGATSSSYLIPASVVGHRLSVQVTGAKTGYRSASTVAASVVVRPKA